MVAARPDGSVGLGRWTVSARARSPSGRDTPLFTAGIRAARFRRPSPCFVDGALAGSSVRPSKLSIPSSCSRVAARRIGGARARRSHELRADPRSSCAGYPRPVAATLSPEHPPPVSSEREAAQGLFQGPLAQQLPACTARGVPDGRLPNPEPARRIRTPFSEPESAMPRPICLFTGQWADLPLEVLARKAKDFGYDGLELACWGDHFDVARCNQDKDWAKKHWAVLQDHGLSSFAISTHLVGQAVCDRIDERHKSILPPAIWGDGKPEGVQQRAAKAMKNTARAAAKLG